MLASPVEYRGKTFWVAYLQSEIGPDPFELSIHITASKATTVTVRLPAAIVGSRGEQEWVQVYDIRPGEVTNVIIPQEYTFKSKKGRSTNKGLYIEAADDIMVVAKNSSGSSSDATIVIPVQYLGSHYYITQYAVLDKKYPTQYIVLATEDSTEIELNNNMPSSEGKAGTYTVKLNKGDYHLVQSAKDLTGSWVKEKNGRKIAVFSGSTCAYVPKYCQSCDHLFEQMLPIENWGYEFIIAPFNTRKKYIVRILAKEDNTYVDINGSRQSIAKAGKYLDLELNDAAYITATRQVQICQYTIGTHCDEKRGDPSMVMVKPALSFTGKYSLPAMATEQITHYYATVVVKTSDLSLLRINGETILGSEEELPYKGEYSFAHVKLEQGNNSIECNCKYSFISYGLGWYESYVY